MAARALLMERSSVDVPLAVAKQVTQIRREAGHVVWSGRTDWHGFALTAPTIAALTRLQLTADHQANQRRGSG